MDYADKSQFKRSGFLRRAWRRLQNAIQDRINAEHAALDNGLRFSVDESHTLHVEPRRD